MENYTYFPGEFKNITLVKKDDLVFNDIENLEKLPISEGLYKRVVWKSLSDDDLDEFYIFPKEFKPENFNQGNTGLCFLFSCLASIAGVPGLIRQLFGNTEYWKITKGFIVYLFYNKERKEICINDKFPFYLYDIKKIPWIWSLPADKELFIKILEKAYIKYQLIYGAYKNQHFKISGSQGLLIAIDHIIYDGGLEKDAMKLLINTKEYRKIYSSGENNINNSEQIFKTIKYYLEDKKALVTLARFFDNNQYSGHAYSVVGAWKVGHGKNIKNVLCIKNPWICGSNQQENFDLDSLNDSLENYPELIEFNKRYFYPSNNVQTFNHYDYLVNNDYAKGFSSIFVAPIDYLINNGLRWIEAHVPDYEKDFPSVNLELELYNKLDKLFSIIQSNNTKNVFDSMENRMSTVTRVISVGDKNTREIISDIYNKKLFKITKNGRSYCEIKRMKNGDYSFNSFSKLFQSDYLDNNCILVNNKTGQKKVITLDNLINSGFKGDGNHDLITMQHIPKLLPKIKNNIVYNSENIQTKQINLNKIDSEHNYFLIDKVKPRIFKNFTIKEVKKNKKEHKRINYKNGYYIGWTLNDKRHGEGTYYFYDGDYKKGEWKKNEFIDGTVKLTFDDGYYIGEYSNNSINGKGTYFYKDGDYKKGDWFYGNFSCGNVLIHYYNGYYKGEYMFNKKYGYGEEKEDGVIYQGYFQAGERHGKFRVIDNGDVDYVEYEYGIKKSKCIIF